jgi:hypothetical protein
MMRSCCAIFTGEQSSSDWENDRCGDGNGSEIHHQSIALVDLATSCVQQAAIRQACDFAAEALACLEHTRSIRVFQRLLTLRSMLNPWENVVSVKHLDERLYAFASALLRGGS